MTKTMRRGASRSAVGVCVAVALMAGLMASPASATFAPPEGGIYAELKGGEIVLGEDKENPDQVFELGVKDGSVGSGICDKNEDRSNVTADVDATGGVDNFDFFFAQGSSGVKGSFFGTPYEVCVRLAVTNAGAMAAQITNKDIQVSPGPQIDVTIIVKNQSNGNTLATCATNSNVGDLGGAFSEPKPFVDKDPGDWNLDLFNKDKFFVPEVQATSSCPSFVANAVNDGMSLPNDGNVHLKFLGYNV